MTSTMKESEREATRALAAFPAGSNGEFNLPPELSMVIARGDGCRLWSTTGDEYLDFSMGWGSALVGHNCPDVTAAVCRQAPLGANFAYVTEPSLDVAEEIIRASPACERIRFCASGTEATMYCLRLAAAFTGRSKVLRFEGAYHGAHDVGVTSLFPAGQLDFPLAEPSSAGLGPHIRDHVLVAPFNDLATTSGIISQFAGELSAVIVEPLHRCLPPSAEFLPGLRDVTTRYHIPLIFDEVVTGFRLAFGGAQEYYGVLPDLVAYGKALGGGYAIGAFGARQEIMQMVDESRLGRADYVWTASTLGGNPISTAAARAALGVLRRPDAYQHLHRIGSYLRRGMRKVLDESRVSGQIIGDGPLAQVVFGPADVPITDYRSLKRADAALSRAVMLELFRRRVFLNPMGTKLYLSLAHDEAACDEFLGRFRDALAQSSAVAR